MVKIINDSMLNLLNHIKPNSIDSIVTDPPYELNFMNKGWDNTGIAFQKETWQKCYEVLKPGGYLLAFGGSRTFHRIACAIEDAGFEIRDCIMWLYGSGFPKSMNLGLKMDKKQGCPDRGHRIAVANRHHPDGTFEPNGEKLPPYEAKTELGHKWNGWGTCLKPAFEPIIVARKPFKGSLADNVIEYGVGGINIDECRVEYENTTNPATNPLYRQQNADKYKQVKGGELSNGAVSWTSGKNGVNEQGRFPANVILTYDETDFEEVCGGFPSEKGNSASRYFYCAKASKKDRDEGLDDFEENKTTDGCIRSNAETARKYGANSALRKNIHPTVKPTTLMQYLVRLVTPKGGTVLDPFMGSGSTGKAVAYENKERKANYNFIGIELSFEYCEIARARIEYVEKQKKTEKLSIFNFIGE